MNNLFTSSPSVQSSRILYTPSPFARSSLLHLQEVGSLTAIKPCILAVRPRKSKLTKALPRFKSGIRILTRVVLEKYVAALGKHIELRINDEE